MDRKKTKDAALKVLEQMNALIRDENFAKMVVSKKYETLAERIRSLGWLALVGGQSVVETPNGKELRARLPGGKTPPVSAIQPDVASELHQDAPRILGPLRVAARGVQRDIYGAPSKLNETSEMKGIHSDKKSTVR